MQNNRGDGGQNEIGPELFRDIGVLRTSELLSAHRIDGAEQYFTRAIDYGYSFDPEEVIDKWGRKEIVGDYVRLIRTLRPDVIVTMNIQGRGGDRAHEATTVLVREAFRAAGDPSMYPEQIRRKACGPGSRRSCTSRGGQAGPGGGQGRTRRPGERTQPRSPDRRETHAGQHRSVRSAAGPHLCRNRHRRAQQSQVPGHGRAAGGPAVPRRTRRPGRGGAVAAGAGTDAGRGAAPAGRGGGRGYSLVDTTSPGRCRRRKPPSSTASTPA